MKNWTITRNGYTYFVDRILAAVITLLAIVVGIWYFTPPIPVDAVVVKEDYKAENNNDFYLVEEDSMGVDAIDLNDFEKIGTVKVGIVHGYDYEATSDSKYGKFPVVYTNSLTCSRVNSHIWLCFDGVDNDKSRIYEIRYDDTLPEGAYYLVGDGLHPETSEALAYIYSVNLQ